MGKMKEIYTDIMQGIEPTLPEGITVEDLYWSSEENELLINKK